MAEYVNKEQLGRKFIIEMLSPSTTTIFDAKDIIDGLQPADVIERSKIDRAIEEIKELPTRGSVGMDGTNVCEKIEQAVPNNFYCNWFEKRKD